MTTDREGLPPNAQYVTWPRWASAAVIIWIVTSTFGGTWWVATYTARTDARIATLERATSDRSAVKERLTRLEERLVGIQTLLQELRNDR